MNQAERMFHTKIFQKSFEVYFFWFKFQFLYFKDFFGRLLCTEMSLYYDITSFFKVFHVISIM